MSDCTIGPNSESQTVGARVQAEKRDASPVEERSEEIVAPRSQTEQPLERSVTKRESCSVLAKKA